MSRLFCDNYCKGCIFVFFIDLRTFKKYNLFTNVDRAIFSDSEQFCKTSCGYRVGAGAGVTFTWRPCAEQFANNERACHMFPEPGRGDLNTDLHRACANVLTNTKDPCTKENMRDI